MSIYDNEGNELSFSAEVTSEQIREAFAKALTDGTIKVFTQIGDTLGIADMSFFDKNYMDTAYANFLNAYKAHPNSVPFFIQSDEHGRGLEINRYANNIDIDGIEYFNINGGDTNIDVYDSAYLGGLYERIKYVKNHIGIAGNHDYKVGNENISPYVIRKTFCTTNLYRRQITSTDLNCYVAYHNRHSVKAICIDPYDIRGVANGMPHPYINSEVATWVIEELSREDGLDIIVLIHEPQWKRAKTRTDESYSAIPANNGNTPLYDLFVARKSKTSGTYTDDEGASHSYDFTGCKTDLLCEIGGHKHDEMFCAVDGLTVYVQDWAGGNKYGGTFGLIDRDNNLLRIFSFDNVSGVKEELDLSLQ